MLDQPITALGPDATDIGDRGRRQRRLAIAALVKITKNKLRYSVPSQSGKGRYVVNLDDDPFCSCPDFELRQLSCKHIYGVQYLIQREENPGGTVPAPQPERITYTQDWSAYNAAQVIEALLKILCHNICVLIQSMYELGITPLFTGNGAQNSENGHVTVGRPHLN